MQFGQLRDETTYSDLIKQPVWFEVFEWLRGVSNITKNGIHEIRGRQIYANVMDEPTLKREDAIFEVHEKYVDIHYCISGDEIIEYCDSEKLEKKTEFDSEKDVQLFFVGEEEKKKVKLGAKDYAVFYPGEAHAPRIKLFNDRIKKVVVKIDLKIISS